MKTTPFILALLLSASLSKAQNVPQVSYFPLQDVKLLDSPFLQAQQTDLHYILALNPDRLLAPFLREAGLTPKAPSYTNWENTGLDGHIGGHYLSALSMMYAATGDTAIYNRLNYMLDELYRAQQAVGTGFIGGTPGSLQLWKEIKAGNIRAGGFDLNGKWVPLYKYTQDIRRIAGRLPLYRQRPGTPDVDCFYRLDDRHNFRSERSANTRHAP